ncbi:Gfo/Idh/MocA family oxidoreductase [Candidatus Calescamantes bacterium]|nr:Gfo/Idh/MocA family oxidoreductase [Candidatus Calescamantes bacterium]
MKVINLGIIGMGRWAREAHLKNLKQLEDVFEITAISSRSEKNIEKAREIIGKEVKVYREWRRLIKDEEIEAVIITTPNHTHEEIAFSSLEYGKHVLVEKPPALTVEGCRRLIALAREKDRILQVGLELRYSDLFQKAKEIIKRGEIGDIQLMWCREFRGPFLTQWRLNKEISGGTLLEKNTHHFDLFNWFAESIPVKVCGMGGKNVEKESEVIDNAFVLVEYEKGIRAALLMCLFSPYGDELEIGIIGDKGKIVCFDKSQRILQYSALKPDSCEYSISPSPGVIEHEHHGTLKELKDFAECIRKGKTPLSDGFAGELSVAVALSAEKSVGEGKYIYVPRPREFGRF